MFGQLLLLIAAAPAVAQHPPSHDAHATSLASPGRMTVILTLTEPSGARSTLTIWNAGNHGVPRVRYQHIRKAPGQAEGGHWTTAEQCPAALTPSQRIMQMAIKGRRAPEKNQAAPWEAGMTTYTLRETSGASFLSTDNSKSLLGRRSAQLLRVLEKCWTPIPVITVSPPRRGG